MRLGTHELIISNEQDVGQRERQEDYFAFWFDEDKDGTAQSALFVLADGMGGHEGGDAASVLAVDAFKQSIDESEPTLPLATRLEAAAQGANLAVFRVARDTGSDIGCTLVALYLTTENYQWISIGDSILYRWRGGRLLRLNTDHNLGTRLDRQLSRGEISEEEAIAREGERAYLTSNLGFKEIPEIELSAPETLLAGDRFVLASDGLSDTLEFSEIEHIVQTSNERDIATRLVRETLVQGNPHQDNATVVSVSLQSPVQRLSQRALVGGLTVLFVTLLALIALVVTYFFGNPIPPKNTVEVDDQRESPPRKHWEEDRRGSPLGGGPGGSDRQR